MSSEERLGVREWAKFILEGEGRFKAEGTCGSGLCPPSEVGNLGL